MVLKINLTVLTLLLLVQSGGTQEALRIGMLSGALEYDSDSSLTILRNRLEKDYLVEIFWMQATDYRIASDMPPGFPEWMYDIILAHGLDNLEALDSIDVLIIFCRRLILSEEEMDRIKAFTLSGTPIVGIRSASHAFQLWLEFDNIVLGGDYDLIHSNDSFETRIFPDNSDHPILDSVAPWTSSILYQNHDMGPNTTILMTGEDTTYGEHPIAWTNMYNDTRMFYASPGAQSDFQEESYLRLLLNALDWTTSGGLIRKDAVRIQAHKRFLSNSIHPLSVFPRYDVIGRIQSGRHLWQMTVRDASRISFHRKDAKYAK
jgi:type 1 glutamine amidotransferase